MHWYKSVWILSPITFTSTMPSSSWNAMISIRPCMHTDARMVIMKWCSPWATIQTKSSSVRICLPCCRWQSITKLNLDLLSSTIAVRLWIGLRIDPPGDAHFKFLDMNFIHDITIAIALLSLITYGIYWMLDIKNLKD
jgi:hypothetical protein